MFASTTFSSHSFYLYWVAKPPLKPGLLASFQFSAELRDKGGFTKVVVNRAGCLQEWSQGEFWLYSR